MILVELMQYSGMVYILIAKAKLKILLELIKKD